MYNAATETDVEFCFSYDCVCEYAVEIGCRRHCITTCYHSLVAYHVVLTGAYEFVVNIYFEYNRFVVNDYLAYILLNRPFVVE